jgi:hypothetical protein
MQKRETKLDDCEKDVFRRTIFGFYDSGEFPTEKKLALQLRDKINYRSSVSSIYKILKSVGFKYRETNDGRKFLMERRDIVAARNNFLRTVHNLRQTGEERPVFYLDETWVNQNHSKVHLAGLVQKGRFESSSRKILCATQDQQKRALFLRESGSFVHVHKCETPIIIRR